MSGLVAAITTGTPSARPVATELLDGVTLRVAAENFSLDAPSPDWHWLQAPQTEPYRSLYLCERNGGGQFVALVTTDTSLDEGVEWFERALGEAQISQVRQGRSISNLTHQRSSAPTPGSQRWVAQVEVPGTGRMDWHGVAVRGDRIYLLQYFGSDPDLVAGFERWVASFRTLRPAGRGARGWLRKASITLDLIALAIGVAAGWLINKVARRPLLNPGSAAARLILVVVAAEAVLLWNILPKAPESAALVLGSLVANALIPFLCALAISSLFRKVQKP